MARAAGREKPARRAVSGLRVLHGTAPPPTASGAPQLRLASAETSLQQAQESYALLQQRYAAGLSPMADLLGACDALTRARFERVRAESGLIAALVSIQFQNGTFLQAFMHDKEITR